MTENRDPKSESRWHLVAWLVVGGLACGLAACAMIATNDGDSRVAQPQPDTADPADRFRRDDGELGTYRTEKAFPGLEFRRPLCVVAPKDNTNRLFVAEQHGVISAFENTRDAATRQTVLDISAKVRRNNNEEGLLGFDCHPRFAENGYIYVHYTANSPTRGVISRFTLDAETHSIADPASEVVLLEQPQRFGNHNGGAVVFGPDGYLYLTFGDGGAQNDPFDAGQNLGTWLAKVLRIDVDRRDNGKTYAIPPDNPFVGVEGALPEVWAYGLRNMWRLSFDSASGLCIGGDVGQNTYEEVDIIVRGGNYGWRAYEATHEFRGPARGREHRGPYIMPIIEYTHREGQSITGGYVYRGTKLPGLQGAYVYADYQSGAMWALRYDGQKVTSNQSIGRHQMIASFGVDQHDELLLCSFDGYLHRLVPDTAVAPAGRLPQVLSDTGLFESPIADGNLTPKKDAGLVPYDVRVPLWSAGAGKQRWLRLPPGKQVTRDESGGWQFPPGTLFIKHFAMQVHARDGTSTRPLETRILIVQPREGDPLRGFTYVWNDDGTEAHLLSGHADTPLVMTDADGKRADATWHFPSRAECMSCHTAAGGHVLGFRPEQLQLAKLMVEYPSLFADGVAGDSPAAWPDWTVKQPDAASEEQAVRAYLDANCAFCHQPGGPGNASIDLRAATPLKDTHLMNVRPGQGDSGVENPRLIAPGSPDRSVLLARMATVGPGSMPNVAHTAVDQEAILRIRKWIAGMKPVADDSEDF